MRVSESVPLLVRGIDLLGHAFEERTATLTLNLQGCRYFSKYHLPRNSWITLEVGDGAKRRNVRARVAWIHRPHSIRDFFQVAIELEEPANVWNLEGPPAGWPEAPTAGNLPHPDSSDAAETRFDSPNIPMEGPTVSMTSYPFAPASNFEKSFAADSAGHDQDSTEQSAAIWRERLAQEMAVAQRQWDELLQSSIDRTLQRLCDQLPERAQHAVSATEEKMAEQFANLGQLLNEMSAEAQSALAGVKASIDQELWRARDALEGVRQQTLDRIGAEAEARVAPHAARVPELVRELSGREDQIAESLRLHRDRLRQASDGTLRDIASQIEATAATLRGDFETARLAALAKWQEELDALSARAGHSAGESISRTSEWLQQETHERLQVLSEQTLATASANFESEISKAANQFATHLEGQSVFHLTQVYQQLDGLAGDVAVKTRTQLSEAAEVAAASFGQVLHDLSAEQAQKFNQTSQSTLEHKRQELESFGSQVRATFESHSTAAIENLKQQTASHMESSLTEARITLAAESAAALDAHRTERDARTRDWAESLNRITDEAAVQCNERIQTAADSWTIASVRRLNEHGQNIIESLVRSADQALRDSASRIFEGLATTLRENGSKAPANASFAAAAPLPPDVQPENYSVQPGA